jgi:hypothetical protein
VSAERMACGMISGQRSLPLAGTAELNGFNRGVSYDRIRPLIGVT